MDAAVDEDTAVAGGVSHEESGVIEEVSGLGTHEERRANGTVGGDFGFRSTVRSIEATGVTRHHFEFWMGIGNINDMLSLYTSNDQAGVLKRELRKSYVCSIPLTYLCQISAQWLLAEHMESLLDGTQGLGCVDIGASRHPDGIETGHVDHLLVAGKDLDVGVFVGFARPLQLVVPGAADSDDIGTRYATGQRVDVTLAHAAETSDGDV